MKYLPIFLLIILLGCKVPDSIKPLGICQAELNGNDWLNGKDYKVFFYKGSVLSNTQCSKYIYTFSINVFNNFQEKRENLTITNLPVVKGKFIVKNDSNIQCEDSIVGSGYYLLGEDGDVLVATYKINENMNNSIEITTIDKVNKFIEGNFNLTFNKFNSSINSVDIIEFKKASFKVYYNFDL